jgi:hypothetical protein
MKKIILATVMFAGFAIAARADFSLSQWQFQKDAAGFSKGLVDVQLDKEIFAGSSRGLADVRVVDNVNQEVPYKLVTARSEDAQKQYNPKVLNNSVVAGKFTTAIMDLGERGIVTNFMTVRTPSENFQRNVTVYGSDDQNSWNILKSNAYIYDYTDKKGNLKTQNTSVAFPESVFQFLKIEISDAENNPVVISSIAVSQFTKKSAQEFSTSANFETSQDSSAKTTVLMADLGQGGIPTNKIVLSVGGENFNRAVSVYSASDRVSANWRNVGQGYVFRYNTPKFAGENSYVSISETTDRYLKIVIYNNDNAPLIFSKVETFATLRDLIFEAEAGKTYKIFYGNAKAAAPQYDLEKYFQYLDLNSAQNATLSLQQNNSNFVPEKKPLTEQNTFLIPSLLGLACLMLLVLVYKFLKKG